MNRETKLSPQDLRRENYKRELREGIYPSDASARDMEVYDKATKKDTRVRGGNIKGEDGNWYPIDGKWAASFRLQWLINKILR